MEEKKPLNPIVMRVLVLAGFMEQMGIDPEEVGVKEGDAEIIENYLESLDEAQLVDGVDAATNEFKELLPQFIELARAGTNHE